MQLVYKFGFHRQTLEIEEGDENIRIKIFNSMLQKVCNKSVFCIKDMD